MKKVKFIVLSIILLVSLCLPLASAKKTEYKAGGRITGYEDAWSSEIVTGQWDVSVTNGEVTKFNLNYIELNLDSSVENSPVGSTDHFKFSLIEATSPVIFRDILTFDCTMHVMKLKSMMDGTKSWIEWDTVWWPVTISPEGLHYGIEFYTNPPNDFNIQGITRTFKTSILGPYILTVDTNNIPVNFDDWYIVPGDETEIPPNIHPLPYYDAGTVVSVSLASACFICTFDHWELDGVNVGGTMPSTTVTMNGDHNLFAYWIPNTVTVTSPNGGENWVRGTTHEITWSHTGVLGRLDIELWKGGLFYSHIGQQLDGNVDSFDWTIESGLPVGADYVIKIYGEPLELFSGDSSDSYFTIG